MSDHIITGPNQKPDPHLFYGDNYERGLSPWHESAYPSELRHEAQEHGERKQGWFIMDSFGNQIGFIPDGTKFSRLVSVRS